jgi:hypothetical protein
VCVCAIGEGVHSEKEETSVMEKDVSIMDMVHPDLFEAPHKLDELLRFIAGAWQPDLSQQEQLVTHLMTCSYCRVALITVLSGEEAYMQKLQASSKTALHDLLLQFVTIHHKLDALTYECIGAYAEALVTVGNIVADKRFSVLAEHMQSCVHCRLMLADMVTFLNESEETS